MKKYLILIIFCISTAASGQNYKNHLFNNKYYSNVKYHNTISASVQPNDLGYGIRYDYHFKELGLYGSLTINGKKQTFVSSFTHN